MSNEIIPSSVDLKMVESLAEHAVKSRYFTKLGGMGGVVSIMLFAKEIGLPPMQALFGGMHDVLGKIEVAPVTMNALIRRAGHKIKVVEHTDKECTLEGIRSDTGDTMTVSYTMDDARRAQLVKAGSGWEKYPKDMLWARAISRLCRRLFPDVIGPMYVTGETSEGTEADDQVSTIDIKPEEQKAETEELSLEGACSLIAQRFEIPNDEILFSYLTYIKSVSSNPFSEMVENCLKKKDMFIEYMTEWKKKNSL